MQEGIQKPHAYTMVAAGSLEYVGLQPVHGLAMFDWHSGWQLREDSPQTDALRQDVIEHGCLVLCSGVDSTRIVYRSAHDDRTIELFVLADESERRS